MRPLRDVDMCADSVGRTLLATAVPPGQRRDGVLRRVPVLGRRGEVPARRRPEVLAETAAAEAVAPERAGDLDAEAVASWIVRRYPAASYPAVMLGSPHGAAVHLAAACGAAWLPTTFTVTVAWPDGRPERWRAAMRWGSVLAARILARNPGVAVRQVHDPVLRGPLSGATVSLQVRWTGLPAAYRKFLSSRLAAKAGALLMRDLRTWPVMDGPLGYGFQLGTPASGWGEAGYHGGADECCIAARTP